MASENELQIVLTLIDNASAELKKITGEVKKETQEVTKETEKATKSIQEQFKEASSGLREIRRASFIAVAALATIIASVKEASQYNLEAKKSFDEFTLAGKNFSVMLGSSLTSALSGVTALIKGLTTVIESAIAGFIKAFSFVAEFFANIGKGPVEAYKRAMLVANLATDEFIKKTEEIKTVITRFDEAKNKVKDMNEVLNQLNLLYLTGQISAQQYYDTLSSNNIANFQNMQMQMQLTQQMAAQENLMRNQSLMDYSEDVQARMGLLKTLQSYHHTVYSTMMDFANMAIQKISTGMTTALTGIIMGTKRAREAWTEFGQAMITAIVEFVIQYGIQMLIAAALSKIIMSSTIAQATAIASAWLPAAIFASIATLGAADVAGVTALGTATATGMGIGAAAIVGSRTVDLGVINVTKSSGAGGGFAEGGWVGLNGPQMALVGERGPEYVVPNNRLGNMGTSIHIEINNPVVRSDEDIDKLTEEISLRLAREAERL